MRPLFTVRDAGREGSKWSLAGLFIIDDDEDSALRAALNLEPGVTEIPLVIQDKQFTKAGELTYDDNPLQKIDSVVPPAAIVPGNTDDPITVCPAIRLHPSYTVYVMSKPTKS